MQADLNALNQQAIAAAKPYMGQFAPGTVVLIAATIAAYVASYALVMAGVMPVWLAFCIIAATTYMGYTPLHEAVHNNINGNHRKLQWLNDLCGYLGAQLIMVPYASHTVEHSDHHRHTNHPDKDPDYIVSRITKGHVFVILAILHFLWRQVTYLPQFRWAKAAPRTRMIYCLEVAVMLGWRIALLAVLPWAVGLTLVVAAYLVGGAFTAYWFAYRPHVPYKDPARYRNTASLIMPAWMKPLEWFWLGQNIHSVHHAFPRVPFYRYQAVYAEIEPTLRAYGGDVIGIFSRQPLPAARTATAD